MTSRPSLHSISASQALTSSHGTGIQSPPILTGSLTLDTHISPAGGLLPSKVHELCGPPGAGKTAMAMQMAATTLIGGHRVSWIDTAHPLPHGRLLSMLTAHMRPDEDPEGYMASLKTWHAPTLPHLLALLLHPQTGQAFPPEATALLVIDNIGTVFTAAYPPGGDDFTKNPQKRSSSSPMPQTPRKFAVMETLGKALERLAVTRKLAIVVINQMTTRVISGAAAVLQPAVVSPSWSAVIGTRLYVHRGNVGSRLAGEVPGQQVRFVAVLKANGVSYHDFESGEAVRSVVVPIRVYEEGIVDMGPIRPIKDNDNGKKLQAQSQASPLPESHTEPSTLTIASTSSTPPPEAEQGETQSLPLPPSLTSSSPLSPPPPPSQSPPPTTSFTATQDAVPPVKRQKSGLEMGVVQDSDEDSEGGWSDDDDEALEG